MLRGYLKHALMIGLGFFLLTESVMTSKTAQDSARVASEETYDKVLDLVFPRDILQEQKLRYVFVLRYEPTFHTESQLVIAEGWDKTEVIEYKSLDGSIEMKLDEIVRRTGKEDAEQMAKQIRIQKRHIKISRAEIRLLQERFFESLRLSEKKLIAPMPDRVMVTQDGTGYRLWYSGITDIHSDLSGSGIKVPTRLDESPLIDWMKSVYRRVEAAPTVSNH